VPRSESSAEALDSDTQYQVTIIDASPIVPAADAASSDINKIVRTSYSDPFYAQLAKEAMDLWKEGTICGSDTYHELVLQPASLFLYLESEGVRVVA
jgi:glycine/D-amino acid oxidase-like deaminating enzyme